MHIQSYTVYIDAAKFFKNHLINMFLLCFVIISDSMNSQMSQIGENQHFSVKFVNKNRYNQA